MEMEMEMMEMFLEIFLRKPYFLPLH